MHVRGPSQSTYAKTENKLRFSYLLSILQICPEIHSNCKFDLELGQKGDTQESRGAEYVAAWQPGCQALFFWQALFYELM